MCVLGCVYSCVFVCVRMGVRVCVVWVRMCVVGSMVVYYYVRGLVFLEYCGFLVFFVRRGIGF